MNNPKRFGVEYAGAAKRLSRFSSQTRRGKPDSETPLHALVPWCLDAFRSMYHALLTNRYLTSRVIPLIAVAAVALCVALVIIVVSVMTGFLNMVRDSGRTLMGDVVISYPVTGIPHYERLIERIEELPEAQAATPVVDSWGSPVRSGSGWLVTR